MNINSFQLTKLSPYLIGILSLMGSLISSQINAQIIPDQTLGQENSLVLPNQTIKNLPSDLVEGGAIRGSNLFHSFSEFNINEARGVYFANPNGIENILTRVTGSNLSQILGTLGVLGNANFYLINPNGIIFGTNASLDINGAFVGATADSILFDNYEFSASNPQAPPLLNINIPLGLNFRENAGDITNNASLNVPNNLTLAGKNININGEITTEGSLNLQADNEVISNTKYNVKNDFLVENLTGELGDLISEEGTKIETGGNVKFNSYAGASLQILAGGSVNIPGTITINKVANNNFIQDNITLSDGTEIMLDGTQKPTLDIRSGIANNESNNLSNSADININEIKVTDGGQILLTNQYQNNDLLGNINITKIDGVNTDNNLGGANVIIDSRNQIALKDTIDVSGANYEGFVTTNAVGNGGNVTFLAQDDIIFDSLASIYSSGLLGGNITLKSNSLISILGGFIGSITVGEGKGGDIQLEAPTILIDGGENFFGGVYTTMEGIGKGGNINIKTQDLSIQNVGFFQTETYTDESGDITIDADHILIDNGGFIATFLYPNSTGNSGNISLTTESLELHKGSQINFQIYGNGDGGALNINAQLITLDGVGDFGSITGINSVAQGGEGNGGIVNIQTESLNATNGAQIRSSTNSDGNAGTINIQANSISLDGFDIRELDPETQQRYPTGIFSETITSIINGTLQEQKLGNAGAININTSGLSLTNGAQISSSTDSLGNAGIITINATNLNLDGKAISEAPFLVAPESRIGVEVFSRSPGEGGLIEINTNSLSLTNEAKISASISTAQEMKNDNLPSNGGNININASDLVTLDNASISSAVSIAKIDEQEKESIGNAGNIFINTPQLLLNHNGSIKSSTAGLGNAGTVTIQDANLISLDDNSIISTAIETEGNATIPSNITLDTQQLQLNNNSSITAGVSGEGVGGNIVINATDNVFLDSSNINSALENTGKGKGGDITLTTPNLSLKQSNITVSTFGQGDSGKTQIITDFLLLDDFAQITASTAGEGNPGSIFIDANQEMSLNNNSTISTAIATTGVATQASNITINTNNLNLNDNANIIATTEGKGNAGNISISNHEQKSAIISLNNSQISTEVGATATNTSNPTPSNITLNGQQISLTNKANINASTLGEIPAGSVNINSNNLSLNQTSQIETLTKSSQNAGNITINSAEGITISDDDSGLFAQTESGGNAGNILINTPTLIIESSAQVSAFTSGSGNGGNIIINAPSDVTVKANSELTVETRNAGKAGDITITSNQVNLGDNAQISATATATSTNTQGGGSITINASNLVLAGELGIFAETQGDSPAGSLRIQPNNDNNLKIEFTKIALISASTRANGQGGNIDILAPNSVEITGEGKIAVETSGRGNAGNININTDNLAISNDVEISASTIGQGSAGNILLNANQITLTNAEVNAFTDGLGNAGSILLTNNGDNVNQVSLNNASISTAIRQNGIATNPSNINILADNINLDNASITASTSGIGQAGNINIPSAQNITLTNNSQIVASTSGQGNTGDINLNASENINLSHNSQINSSVEIGGKGNSQGVTLNTPNLTLTNNATISAATAGVGNAGKINIPNTLNVSLNNSSVISTAIESTGIATQPSNITINTHELNINNNSQITASTSGIGNAGAIEITTNNLNFNSNAEIKTNTSGSGNAGDIMLNLNGDFRLDNSQIVASTTTESTGVGGNINVSTTESLFLNNQGIIAVDSQGKGNGGNIFLIADGFNLDNNSLVSASTASGEGGNITLDIIQPILLTNNSTVTATAGGIGNGGNMNLEGEFLITKYNSDITANAFKGKGGNINITTLGIFLKDSLITASSQLGVDGVVQTNTPEIDPSRGIVELPTDVVDPSQLISENVCQKGKESEFVITGKGGLPSNPNQLLERDMTEVELINPIFTETTPETQNQSSLPTQDTQQSITPARGWIRNEKGEMMLVGYNPHNMPSNELRKNDKLRCQPIK